MGVLAQVLRAILRVLRGSMSSAEVEAALDQKAAKAGQPLDWRHSIVDLMKLVKMDSSLDARKRLATELGYTGPLDGSAEMNMWLHARVMEKVVNRQIG